MQLAEALDTEPVWVINNGVAHADSERSGAGEDCAVDCVEGASSRIDHAICRAPQAAKQTAPTGSATAYFQSLMPVLLCSVPTDDE